MSTTEKLIACISGGGRRIIVVTKAYIDESGTHNNAPVLSVACYFASAIRWEGFEEEWEGILRKHHIKYFHAKNKDHDFLRPVLANIIQDCKLRGVVTFVNRKMYNTYASGQTKTVLGDAYAACVSNCVIKVCRLVKELYPGKSVSFFIEAGQPKTELLRSKIESMIGRPFDRDCALIASVTLARKTDFTPLQTADFLSHVFSTSDMVWLNRLTSRGLIWFSPMGRRALEQTAGGVKTVFATMKWMRKAIATNHKNKRKEQL